VRTDDIMSPCIIVNVINGIPNNDVVGIYPEHVADVAVRGSVTATP
jgi:hypothetical protein